MSEWHPQNISFSFQPQSPKSLLNEPATTFLQAVYQKKKGNVERYGAVTLEKEHHSQGNKREARKRSGVRTTERHADELRFLCAQIYI